MRPKGVELLRGKHAKSFAHTTIKDRLPLILTKTVDSIVRHDWPLTAAQKGFIINSIGALKYSLTRDHVLPSTNDEQWDTVLSSLMTDENTWFSAPWLTIECLMYKVLQDLVCNLKIDLFSNFKREATINDLTRIAEICHQIDILPNSDEIDENVLKHLIDVSLWGNQADLSLSFTSASSNEQPIIIDDTPIFLPILLAAKTVTIILDNAGMELYSAEYLSAHHKKVILHCKMYPWFISDVTIPDFEVLFGLLSSHSEVLNSQVLRWREFIKNKDWVITTDPFWTTPLPYWYLPKAPVFQSLKSSETDFIIFKGDLNYRKMVFDAAWPATTEFTTAIGPLAGSGIADFVMLRTCKADTCVGLAVGQAEELDGVDADWMVNGKYGMIQTYVSEELGQ